MRLDLTPARNSYVAPDFGGDDHQLPADHHLHRRMRRPMAFGAGVVGALILGLGAWASVYQIPTGISAPGQVKIEANRKTLRARAVSTVRQVLVREGQFVRAGQPMVIFNDVEARAAYDVTQNQVDQVMAQIARFEAEATGRSSITFSPELMARAGDPKVAQLIQDQQALFASRLSLHETQLGGLTQRSAAIEQQVAGDQAQIESVRDQRKLTVEELNGYQKLNEQGYAPKTLILRYQRTLADLDGRLGQLQADIAKLRQQQGETRMNMASLRNDRQSQAAEGLRDAQSKLADALPRLSAARETLQSTVVRAPVDGYVFNLTTFTVGGVVGAGELVVDVVPSGTPATVTAMVKPQEVDEVKVGQKARVRLTGLNQRWNSPLDGHVTVVSADAITNEKTGVSAFRVDVALDPKEIAKLQRDVKITPGMPAEVQIVSGSRSVMGFLISPITDTFGHAFHES